MDRNRMFSSVRNASRFEETAGSKINDSRGHEDVIRDRQTQTYKGYEDNTGIREKINSHRYGHHENGAHSYSGIYESGISDDRDVTETAKYAKTSADSEGHTLKNVLEIKCRLFLFFPKLVQEVGTIKLLVLYQHSPDGKGTRA